MAAVQDFESIVVGVSIPESESFYVFDDPVQAFGDTVGGTSIEVCEELGFPVRDRGRKTYQFRYWVLGYVAIPGLRT